MENSRTPVLRLSALAFFALLVHGYHLGVDDAEIYVPAIKKAADPALYRFGSEFFMTHAHWSVFPSLVGQSARLTRLPINLAIFLFHVAGIYLLLLASWQLVSLCFRQDAARWSGVVLLAGVLTVPVAGIALSIMDPYLTARSLSTPATIFAAGCYLASKPKRSLAWLLTATLLHPQMGAFGASFLACLALGRRFPLRDRPTAAACLASGLPFIFDFGAARGPAREALFSRTYFFVTNWTWYEWFGIFAPLALAWWFASAARNRTTPAFGLLLRSLVVFGALFTAVGLLLTFSVRLENFARLQPMRSFHIVYIVFFLMLGGLIGEYALGRKIGRWLALFIPLAVSMWLVQRSSYPSSSHLEWPGAVDSNRWNAAFVWVRDNTPKDAIFALDPNYMLRPGEDSQGFRAIAERSALAENIKDSGAVAMFPQLAGEWKAEVNAQGHWASFQRADFETLARHYPITWILTECPTPAGVNCPYRSADLAVCRIRPDAVAVR